MASATSDLSKSGVAILDRVLGEAASSLSEDAARTFLSLKFTESDERRMNRLAAKARAGTLTEAERIEAEQYDLVSHFLAFLQAKAGTVLGSPRSDEDA